MLVPPPCAARLAPARAPLTEASMHGAHGMACRRLRTPRRRRRTRTTSPIWMVSVCMGNLHGECAWAIAWHQHPHEVLAPGPALRMAGLPWQHEHMSQGHGRLACALATSVPMTVGIWVAPFWAVVMLAAWAT